MPDHRPPGTIDRRDLPDRPENFSHYIDQCPAGDLLALLDASLVEGSPWGDFAPIAKRAYAPGKWTVTALFQHLVDTERIFAYRLLRIARGDATVLPGFDENVFATAAEADGRDYSAVVEELTLVRRSTRSLVAGLAPSWLQRQGTCSGITISAGSLGFAIIGHERHHRAVLERRYRPLLG